MDTPQRSQTRCVIVGGGPAGMMAGYLLARAGVPVVVLEKHADFNRDFRGDTIHPSTLELMHELGLLDEFLKQPHQEVRADLVIGADGRHSVTHTRAGFKQCEFGVPIDALWMRISKKQDDPEQSLGFFRHGKLLVLLGRGDYWQCGFVIPKGGFDEIKTRGLPEFQNEITSFAGFLHDRVAELDDWSKIKLLTVQINRLRDWCREGLLCIGDSAHAMSPAGGVGINLAIQDAVATANLLAEKLRSGPVSVDDLRKVQARREWPTRLIQGMQVFIHRRVVTGRTSGEKQSLPFVVRLLRWFPVLRQLPARFIGLGPRPEHFRSPTLG